MPILILLRHGQSLWNLENKFTGSMDIDLSPHGCQEAAQAGELLKEYRIDMAYTSTLIRAVHTLEIVLKALNVKIPVKKTIALNERSYGELQGLNKAEVEEKYGNRQYLLWRRSYLSTPPFGESLRDTFQKVVPFYKKEIIAQLKQDKNILIVAHGNSLRALIMFLEKIAPKQINEIEIATATPRKYCFDSNLRLIEVSYITNQKL